MEIKKINKVTLQKLSIFQPNKYKFKKKCPLSIKGAPEIDYKNIKLFKKICFRKWKNSTVKNYKCESKETKRIIISIKRARNLALL